MLLPHKNLDTLLYDLEMGSESYQTLYDDSKDLVMQDMLNRGHNLVKEIISRRACAMRIPESNGYLILAENRRTDGRDSGFDINIALPERGEESDNENGYLSWFEIMHLVEWGSINIRKPLIEKSLYVNLHLDRVKEMRSSHSTPWATMYPDFRRQHAKYLRLDGNPSIPRNTKEYWDFRSFHLKQRRRASLLKEKILLWCLLTKEMMINLLMEDPTLVLPVERVEEMIRSRGITIHQALLVMTNPTFFSSSSMVNIEENLDKATEQIHNLSSLYGGDSLTITAYVPVSTWLKGYIESFKEKAQRNATLITSSVQALQRVNVGQERTLSEMAESVDLLRQFSMLEFPESSLLEKAEFRPPKIIRFIFKKRQYPNLLLWRGRMFEIPREYIHPKATFRAIDVNFGDLTSGFPHANVWSDKKGTKMMRHANIQGYTCLGDMENHGELASLLYFIRGIRMFNLDSPLNTVPAPLFHPDVISSLMEEYEIRDRNYITYGEHIVPLLVEIMGSNIRKMTADDVLAIGDGVDPNIARREEARRAEAQEAQEVQEVLPPVVGRTGEEIGEETGEDTEPVEIMEIAIPVEMEPEGITMEIEQDAIASLLEGADGMDTSTTP